MTTIQLVRMAVPRIYSSDNLGPATDYMENNSNVTAAVRQNDVGYPSLSPMVPTETRLSRLDATNDRSLNNRSSFSFGTREGVTHIPSEPMPAPPNSMAVKIKALVHAQNNFLHFNTLLLLGPRTVILDVWLIRLLF